MKKINKLFGLMVASVAAFAFTATVRADNCVLSGGDNFANCSDTRTSHIIEIASGTVVVNADATVTDKQIVVKSGATLEVNAKLTMADYVPITTSTSGEKHGNEYANIYLENGAKVIVRGTLELEGERPTTGGSLKTIGIDGGNQTSSSNAAIEVLGNGNLTVSGYTQDIRIPYLNVTGGKVVTTDAENGINAGKITAVGGSITSYGNVYNGVTTTQVDLSENAVVDAHENGYNGVTINDPNNATSTVEDSTIISKDNNQDPEHTFGTGHDLSLSENLTVSGESSITAPEASGSGTITVARGSDAEIDVAGNLNVTGDIKKGIVINGNQIYVYTLEGDTLELAGYEHVNTSGELRVYNKTDKDIYVTTPDSAVKEANKLGAGKDEKYTLVKVFAQVNGKKSDEYLVVFKGQQFSELSVAGKTKLDTLLAKEGQHINTYNVTAGQSLTADYTFDGETTVYATYYIVLSIGNYEFWVNPNTRIADLNEADKARLEAIKTASDKKFMYFAVDGKAISETDTRFDKDTTLLVLYEGDAAPVVPETGENDPKPPVPDDSQNQGGQTGNEGAGNEQQGGETQKPNVDNSPTLDTVGTSIAMSFVGLVGIVGSAVVLKKRNNL